MSRNARLSDTFREMAETTTVHGIPKIISAKSIWVKMLWLSIFLGLFGYLSFNLYHLFMKFQSWPVRTSVSLELSTLQFPSVSFCNVNPIKLSKLQDAPQEVREALMGEVATLNNSNSFKSDDINQWWDSFESGSGSGNAANASQDYDLSGQLWESVLDGTSFDVEFEDDLKEILHKKKDSWQERKQKFKAVFAKKSNYPREELGHNLADMLVRCSFDGRECFPEDFKSFFSSEYGNCFTLQKESFKSRQNGPSYGLWLSLNLELPEYITNYADAYGIKLVIHEPGTYAFPSEEGLIISSREETLVGLRRVDVHRINTPNKDCETGDYFKEKLGISYTMTACIALCKQKAMIDTCGCISWERLTKQEDIAQCDPSNNEHEVCRMLIDEAFNSKKLKCNCNPPCTESVYQKTLSGRIWPNDEYLKHALLKPLCSKKNMAYLQEMCADIENPKVTSISELYKQSFMQVVIFYEDLNYEKISEELTYDSYRFMSDIGGTLGLFIGASLLSFAEIIQLMIEICTHFYRKALKVNRVKCNTSVESIHKKELDSN